MISGRAIAALLPSTARAARLWLFNLGGLGLIPLGLLDNSVIPLPGTMDVATILLSARQERLWLYYALMATAGSLMGGFLTYRLARRGGKEALERRFSRGKVDRVCKIFERWGFGAIAIPAVLPPPSPMVPFLFAAGAMQYPTRKFLAALALGPNHQVPDPGLPGRAVRTANHRVHRGTCTSRCGDNHRGADCHGCCGFLFPGKQEVVIASCRTQGSRRRRSHCGSTGLMRFGLNRGSGQATGRACVPSLLLACSRILGWVGAPDVEELLIARGHHGDVLLARYPVQS